jgi:hypothetical protein
MNYPQSKSYTSAIFNFRFYSQYQSVWWSTNTICQYHTGSVTELPAMFIRTLFLNCYLFALQIMSITHCALVLAFHV